MEATHHRLMVEAILLGREEPQDLLDPATLRSVVRQAVPCLRLEIISWTDVRHSPQSCLERVTARKAFL